MLVLTRKIGEEIIINNDIKIAILDVRGREIRIGIEAPKSVKINRKEIHEKMIASGEIEG